MFRASLRLGSISRQLFSTQKVYQVQGSSNFESISKQANTNLCLDFYADWCGPCKSLGPRLQKIIESNKDWSLLKINVDEPLNTELLNKYGVSSMPHLIGLNTKGEKVFDRVGNLPDGELSKLIK